MHLAYKFMYCPARHRTEICMQCDLLTRFENFLITVTPVWERKYLFRMNFAPCKKAGQHGSNVCGYFMSSTGGPTDGIVSTSA